MAAPGTFLHVNICEGPALCHCHLSTKLLQRILLSAEGDARRCPRSAACSDARGVGQGVRHAGSSLGRYTFQAARSLFAAPVPVAKQKAGGRSRHRPAAPGGSRTSAPSSHRPVPPARPSPAQVDCGIAEPQLGRLPSPRTEPHGSWRHVNDVLSYFH